VKLGGGHRNSPEMSLLKFFSLNYYPSHFLAATFDFTSFFTLALWGSILFSQLGCFCIDLNLHLQHHSAKFNLIK